MLFCSSTLIVSLTNYKFIFSYKFVFSKKLWYIVKKIIIMLQLNELNSKNDNHNYDSSIVDYTCTISLSIMIA